MANILGSTLTLLDQMEAFNTLRTFPLNQFAQMNQFSQLLQMNQWNLLHANQASVPEGTPAPGFERFMPLPQNLKSDQQVPTAPAADYITKRFMDDLNEAEDGEIDIFNGSTDYPDCIDLDFDPTSLPDVDVTVFDQVFNVPPAYMKAEAKSPSYCDSVYSLSSYSPPHSPISSPRSPISDISSSAYSTDEGIVEDMHEDLQEILERMSSSGSPLPVCDELEKQSLPDVKEEQPATPPKGRRKRGPKPPVKYSGTGPIQLWQFLLELLIDPESKNLIQWTHEEDYEFKILQPSTVAKKWGKQKNKPTMNYEKLSRGLRYYYGKSVIEKVHGKRYVYQFLCNIPKILGYDPMAKCEDAVEDSVCGEPVMSPEVEDLLVTSSLEDGKLDGSFDFGLFF